MKTNIEAAISYMTATDSTATPDQCRSYLERQIRFLGEGKALEKIYQQGRYQTLLAPVESALGDRIQKVRFTETSDEIVTRPGIPLVTWLISRLAEGMTDSEIIAAAKSALAR
jgi:hypothetical protein